MGKKKRHPIPDVQPKPNRQLWVVERTVEDKVKRIYVYADRWFDVRSVGGMKLHTSDYVELFISAVLGEVDVFADEDVLVYEVQWHGHASNNTLERRVVNLRKPDA